MHKNIPIFTLLLAAGISMIFLAWGAYGRYQCMTTHFPDHFKPVTVFEDQAPDSLKPTNFDKGKAIYKRHYIYENIRYQVKISRKEFDEQFYVCEYHPEKAYSESDLVKAGKNLVLAGIELFIALCLFTAAIIICFCRKIPS